MKNYYTHLFLFQQRTFSLVSKLLINNSTHKKYDSHIFFRLFIRKIKEKIVIIYGA